MATQAPQQPSRAQQLATAAAAAAAAAQAAQVSPSPTTPVALPLVATAQVARATAAIIAAALAFFDGIRATDEAFLRELLATRTRNEADIAAAIAEERERGAEFARLMQERLMADLPLALSIPDPARREAAVRGLLAREERYARQRAEAMSARAVALVDRVQLRRDSPQGAYWKSDPTVVEHTAGCLVMSGGGRGRGRFWPWEVLDRVHPPRHPGCFPAGTIVAGPRAIATTARWWEGDIVDVEFASGHRLSVTPNHPVLTPRGWIGAGLLREGDDVLRCAAGDGPPAIRPDHEQVPALIEEVARAVGGSGGVTAVRVPLAAEDFHGDGADGQVCVVRTDGALRDVLDAEFVQRVIKRAVVGADDPRLAAASFDCARSLPLLGGGRRMPVTTGLRRDSPLVLGSAARIHQAVRSRLIAQGDAFATETQLDRGAADAVALGQSPYGGAFGVGGDEVGGVQRRATVPGTVGFAEPFQPALHDALRDAEAAHQARVRLSGAIATDEVVGIERRGFAGHVYNFESAEGWYLAGGVIVHNCPCRLHSYGEAVRRGWLAAGDVLDVRAALNAAQAVVMEAAAYDGETLVLREALIEAGLTTAERFDAVATTRGAG